MSAEVRPDYHFLLIAPNLGAEWLFDAARNYWDTFRPTVIPNFNFLILVPPTRTVNVTVIARRDTAPQIGVELSRIRPDAYFDPVVFDNFEDARAELNRRAQQQQPFGVPLVSPTSTPDPNAPFIPTPRLPATRPPAGFVTSTPVPTQTTTGETTGEVTATPSATPTPDDTTEGEGTRAPLTPASGPITGGG
ncbi:MAG TPA: hypothetical protein VK003_11355 [Oceanobacillus sp.]|nr:hypothetical protein [Oceanobacillus sp.]